MTKVPNKHPIEDLIAVMAALRNPDGGCPWDLQQNFKTIAPYTIEEAYEVADAIERNDMSDLREELGDLLLQPIYHAQMAAEDNIFTIEDVIRDITEKMISRHPHVFGDQNASSPEDVNKIWDAKKMKKKLKSQSTTIAPWTASPKPCRHCCAPKNSRKKPLKLALNGLGLSKFWTNSKKNSSKCVKRLPQAH